MLKQAVVVTFFLLLSSVLGFVAQVSYASYFGAGIDMDIYFLLLAIPSVIIGIAPVIFTSIFLPHFSSIHTVDELMINIKDLGKFVLFFSIAFSVSGCVLSLINIQSIIPNLPKELNSYARIVCCLLWGGAFCSLNSSYTAAVLNFQRKFYLVAFAAILPQSFMILSVVLFHRIAGVKSIAMGYILALFFQWMLFSARTQWITFSIWTRNERVKKYKPLLIRAFLVLVSLLPFTIIGPLCYSFAADLSAGSIAYLGYSASFAGFFSVATSMGVAVVSFPDISFGLISTDIEMKKEILKKIEASFKMVLFISIVISVFLIVLRVPLLTLLLQQGEFSKESVKIMSEVFPFFIIMAVCVSSLNLLRNVLYAKKEYGIIAMIGIVVVFLFVCSALFLREYFSLVGISIAYAFSFVAFFVIVNCWLSDNKFHFLGKRFYWDLIKFIIVSFISIGIVCSILFCFNTNIDSKLQLFVLLLFAGMGYMITVFFLSRHIFKLDEGKLIENSIYSNNYHSMIPPIYLIILLSVFVFYCVMKMIQRNNDIHALAFFILYVYTIFAQIGYAYFPELSILLGAYYGKELFYEYWLFMFLSFLFTYYFYLLLWRGDKIKNIYSVRPLRSNTRYYLFILISFVLYVILNVYFIRNRNLFGWGGGNPMGSNWFVIGFRIHTICTFIAYILCRKQCKLNRMLLFVIYVIFFLQVTFAAGVRSDILYLFIAIAFFELSPIHESFKKNKKKIFRIGLLGVLVIWVLFILLHLRTSTSDIGFSSIVNYESSEDSQDKATSAKILMQDYYSPSHTLFIAMHYGFIDPVETFKSNVANSLVKINYPYLGQKLVYLATGEDVRGAGWSYHFFVEGYNALGWGGIIYNAIMWNLGMMLWFSLLGTNDIFFKRTMLSLLVFLVTNTMRSQTCAFVQYYWMFLIPALVLLTLATNSKLIIKIKK